MTDSISPARLRAVFLSQNHHSLESTPYEVVSASLEGLMGDKHAGFTRPADGRTPWYPRGTTIRNDRQVSIVSVEELDQVRRLLGIESLPAEWLGANLLLEGLPDLSQTPPNTRLFFPSGAVLIVTAENQPCSGPGKLIAVHTGVEAAGRLFPKLALHKRGLVACVEHPGQIGAGDTVEIKRG